MVAEVHAGIEPACQNGNASGRFSSLKQLVLVDEAGGGNVVLAKGGEDGRSLGLDRSYRVAFGDDRQVIDCDGK